MKRYIFAGLAVAIPLGSVLAADAPAPELKNYTRTGQYENCLTNHSIRSLQILNKRQILVSMSGGRAYLAEAEHCSLSKGLTLSYDASIDKLCSTSIIHLLDLGTPVQERGSCNIDRFEKLEKK